MNAALLEPTLNGELSTAAAMGISLIPIAITASALIYLSHWARKHLNQQPLTHPKKVTLTTIRISSDSLALALGAAWLLYFSNPITQAAGQFIASGLSPTTH